MRSVNEVVVVVFHTILAEALLQPLSEGEDLALCFLKRITVVTTVLLVFSCLEKSVTSSENAVVLCTLLRPLTPEREWFVCGQPRGSLGDHSCS